jgi:lipoate synthase/lipoate-protein ligase B
MLAPGRALRLRWLGGHVAYRDAHALQRALWAAGPADDDWLLLLEHSHVYTAGIRTKPEHMLVDPASVGAELLWVDRGGDITYHGPGQLVGYPVLSVPSGPSATPRYVHEVEQFVIEVLARVGLPNVGGLDDFPGVWVEPGGPRPRKICAIGARHSRQRTMHGFALNVNPALEMFGHIVPCGIAGKEVTSLEAEGVHISMAEVVEAVFAVATQRWGAGRLVERQDVAMPASMRAASVEDAVLDAPTVAVGASTVAPGALVVPAVAPVARVAAPLAPAVAREAPGAALKTRTVAVKAPTVAPEAPVAPFAGPESPIWVQDGELVAIGRNDYLEARPEAATAPKTARDRPPSTHLVVETAPTAFAITVSPQAPGPNAPAPDLPAPSAPAVPAAAVPITPAASTTPAAPTPTPSAPARPVRLLGRLGKLAEAGVDPAGALPLEARKPPWLRANAHMGSEFRSLRKTVRGLGLVTVCEEAGCPNIFECWADGTATFMINGDRCTRACGFCQVNTAKPLPLDPAEPEKVAEAVARLGLAHAVVTCVARDDLEDGGASGFAATIEAIRRRCPGTAVEVLISDCKGDPAALGQIFEQRPDVLNHNIETVPRLQRAVRPSASYARSLAVLARARDAGLTTKSGFMLGLGETEQEVLGILADLRAIGVSIVTIGQYLRPSVKHLPVARWWAPEDFARIAEAGRDLGIPQVVASPLTRSSYHARQAAAGAAGDPSPGVATGQTTVTEHGGVGEKDAGRATAGRAAPSGTAATAATAAAIAASSRAELAGGAA